MAVVGHHATVINRSWKTTNVRPFSKDCYQITAVPIVDEAVAHDCPYTLKTYIMVVNNALRVPSMNHNLAPPFILREAGLIVNDVPKIDTRQEDLTNETHCILSKDDGDNNGTNLCIHMKLDGIFSYFTTRNLTMNELENCEYVETVYLSPDAAQWDTYNEEYADTEDRFLDFRGYLVHRQPKLWKILDDLDVFELQVSEEQYKTAIISIVGTKNTCVFKSNDDVDPHSVVNNYFYFITDDDYM